MAIHYISGAEETVSDLFAFHDIVTIHTRIVSVVG
jgi:hypothetical protein